MQAGVDPFLHHMWSLEGTLLGDSMLLSAYQIL